MSGRRWENIEHLTAKEIKDYFPEEIFKEIDLLVGPADTKK